MSDMLGRSNVCLRVSRDCLNRVADDDSNLDIACFNAQQSLESLLKYIIETNGMQAPKTHDIDELLVYARSSGFTYSDENRLMEMSYKISKWETTSRYGQGIKTTANSLEAVYSHIEKIREEFAGTASSKFQQLRERLNQ